jgi:hypothetical protein
MPGSMATGTGADIAMYGFLVAGIVPHIRGRIGVILTMTTTATAGGWKKVTGIMRTTATTITTIIMMITDTTKLQLNSATHKTADSDTPESAVFI